MWGHRVVVPPAGRQRIMEELHEGHPDTSWMKNLARSFVWWPRLDADIEDTVKKCTTCQRSRHLPATAPL